jgi:sucrose-6F-phosphate phosphohydrolase
MTRLLLCTDLDRTLLPNGPQPESTGARERFGQLAVRPEVTLVYVSGRHRGLMEDAIARYQLPLPDYAITDVGTRIYHLDGEVWRLQREWQREIANDWDDLSREDLVELFVDLPNLQLQELEKQNEHKLSYYLPLDHSHERLLPEMRYRLERSRVRAALIWSVDESEGVGLLDVLPAGATKLHAIEFLARQLGFRTQEIVFAGDSGNDLPVLTSGIPSVLVANARSEVREVAVAAAAAAGWADRLYLARGGVPGMNGNYSAGIVEGVLHYLPEAARWLQEGDHAE